MKREEECLPYPPSEVSASWTGTSRREMTPLRKSRPGPRTLSVNPSSGRYRKAASHGAIPQSNALVVEINGGIDVVGDQEKAVSDRWALFGEFYRTVIIGCPSELVPGTRAGQVTNQRHAVTDRHALDTTVHDRYAG